MIKIDIFKALGSIAIALMILLLGAGVVGIFKLNNNFIKFESKVTTEISLFHEWIKRSNVRMNVLENLHMSAKMDFE